MILLDKYLARQIMIGILIAAAVLLPLFSFLDLVEQLDDVGQGFYSVQDAFYFTALMLPRRLLQLMPFIALIGHVIALGRLAVHSEIICMRAAGLSPLEISKTPLRIAICLLVAMAVLEQYIAPVLEQKAHAHRSAALAYSTQLSEDLGLWSRDAAHILRIGDRIHSALMRDIEIFNLDEAGFLLAYIHAGEAEVVDDRLWRLHDVTRKRFNGLQTVTEGIEAMDWQPFLNPEQITTLTLPVGSLSPLDLHQYIAYLKQTGQTSAAYELALWRKPGSGLITIAMVLLSVPFVLGSIRSGLASKLVLAGMTGVCVYLFDQIISNLGLLLNLNLVVVALAPGVLLIWCAYLWLARVK